MPKENSLQKSTKCWILTDGKAGMENQCVALADSLGLIPVNKRIIVEGIGLTKRTLKPSQENPKGGFTERERSIHISNVMILDNNEISRIGFKLLKDKSKVRVSKRSGKELG